MTLNVALTTVLRTNVLHCDWNECLPVALLYLLSAPVVACGHQLLYLLVVFVAKSTVVLQKLFLSVLQEKANDDDKND